MFHQEASVETIKLKVHECQRHVHNSEVTLPTLLDMCT